MLLKTKHAARDRMLARLDATRRARVVFALAPAPQLVRVLNSHGYRTSPTKLTEAQAKMLADAGCKGFSDSDNLPSALPGWRMADRDVLGKHASNSTSSSRAYEHVRGVERSSCANALVRGVSAADGSGC